MRIPTLFLFLLPASSPPAEEPPAPGTFVSPDSPDSGHSISTRHPQPTEYPQLHVTARDTISQTWCSTKAAHVNIKVPSAAVTELLRGWEVETTSSGGVPWLRSGYFCLFWKGTGLEQGESGLLRRKRKFHEHFLYACGGLYGSHIISFPFREGRAYRHPRVQMRKLRLCQGCGWRALHSACGTARDRALV